jgi:Type IV secretion system pilin
MIRPPSWLLFIVAALFIALPLFAPPILVLAQNAHTAGGLVPCGAVSASNILGASECGLCDFTLLIQNIINYLIIISFPVSAALFAWAGIILFTAGDNVHARDKAKDIFKNVGMGLIIALAGYLIVQTVLNVLVNPKLFSGGFTFSFGQCASEDQRDRTEQISTLFTGLTTGTTNGLTTGAAPTSAPAAGTTPVATAASGPGPAPNPNIPASPSVAAGIAQLNAQAPTTDAYGGLCAVDVRQALAAEGYTDFNTNHPASAAAYGPYLTAEGFAPVAAGSAPQAGDVAVFQGNSNASSVNDISATNGHIEMYNGTQWVSDTKQSTFLPGSSWQNVSYQVYRAGATPSAGS